MPLGPIDTSALHHLDDRMLADIGLVRRRNIGPFYDYDRVNPNELPTRTRWRRLAPAWWRHP